MRTTLDLDDELLQRAAELTGRSEAAALVQLGLEALISREVSLRLAGGGGTDQDAAAPARRGRRFVPAREATAAFRNAQQVDSAELRRDIDSAADQEMLNRD